MCMCDAGYPDRCRRHNGQDEEDSSSNEVYTSDNGYIHHKSGLVIDPRCPERGCQCAECRAATL